MRYLLIFLACCALLSAQSTINEDTVHFVGQASAFTVGAELVTDGGFPTLDNWTEGSWTLATGVVSEDNAGGNSDILSDVAIVTVDGTVYRVQFEVTAYTDGNVVAVFDGVEVGGDKSAVGVYTVYVAATDASSTIALRADATFTGSCDNVSVVAWVGDLNAAGGCTIATFTGTLTDYMTATGRPLVIETDQDLTLSDNGSGLLRLTKAGAFSGGLKKGTLVKGDFSATFADGIYEVVSADSEDDDYIDIDLSSGGVGAETASVWVGGAYPDIATAINDSTLSEDPDGKYRKRYICVNVDQVVDAVTDFVAETSEQALREDDGSRKLIAFYDSILTVTSHSSCRIVSDIDEGQVYYGGAWQAFKSDEGFTDIRPNGKWIEWDANGNSINILELNTSNFEIRNFKIHNTATGGTNSLVHADDAAVVNESFINCWFATADLPLASDQFLINAVIADCYYSNSIVSNNLTKVLRSWLMNNIFNGDGLAAAIVDVSHTSTFMGNLFYKGTDGVIGATFDTSLFISNVFFDQTDACLTGSDSTAAMFVINNIFSPAAAADNALQIESTGGTLLAASRNNIFYSVTAGAILTNPIVHSEISPNPPLPVGSLEVNPMFVNPADGDFRLRASSPALNGGLRSLFGGYTTIGVNQPYSTPNAGYRPRYNFKGHNYSDR